jgi:hypothetical protein
VVGSECLLDDGKAAPVERLGVAEAAEMSIQLSQAAERHADLKMVRSECLLDDGVVALVQRLGLVKPALGLVQVHQINEQRA